MSAEHVPEKTGVEADVQQLLDMIARNAVEDARRYVRLLAEKWPDSPDVQHYARVLAPPVARVGGPDPWANLKAEYEWLQEHRREYAGQLIAIRGDKVIFATRDGSEMRRFLDSYPERDKLLVASQ